MSPSCKKKYFYVLGHIVIDRRCYVGTSDNIQQKSHETVRDYAWFIASHCIVIILKGEHIQELLKHNHLQLQLRISRTWFTGKTLLNTQHLNVMLDNTMSRVPSSGNIRSPNKHICVYNIHLFLYILANRIWPCCFRPNSSYVTLYWPLLSNLVFLTK